MSDIDAGGWKPSRFGTVPDLLARAVAAAADEPFMLTAEGTTTYSELDTAVREIAAGLRAAGVARSDRVVTLLANSPDAVAVWLATLTLGAVYVPINTAYRGEFLRHQMNDAGAAVVVAESEFAGRVFELAGTLGSARLLFCRGDGAVTVPTGFERRPFSSLRASGRLDDLPEVRPTDLACLLYTAGTTGPSKGCMLTHSYFSYLSEACRFGRERQDVAHTCLPLFHLNAIITVLVTLGLPSTVSVAPRFSVSGFWDDIERSGARFTNLLGTMALLLARAPDTPAMERCRGQLRRVIAVPFPPEAQEVFKIRFGVQEPMPAVGYGMTEGGPFTISAPGMVAPPGGSGRPTPDFDVQIVDEADNPVPRGVVGEIVCRPRRPHIMFEGYWNRTTETLAAFRNFWFHTGDLGRFDDEGNLYFVDRRKDYLRRRGENISSVELEVAFLAHPAVAEAAAYGVASTLDEDDLQLTVVLEPGAALTPAELWEWSQDKVPHFAVPSYIEFLAELPKNAVGRILKEQLRSTAAERPRWSPADARLSGRR